MLLIILLWGQVRMPLTIYVILANLVPTAKHNLPLELTNTNTNESWSLRID